MEEGREGLGESAPSLSINTYGGDYTRRATRGLGEASARRETELRFKGTATPEYDGLTKTSSRSLVQVHRVTIRRSASSPTAKASDKYSRGNLKSGKKFIGT